VRVLVIGGSYNPVHLGHLVLAQELRRQFGYDLALLVPSYRPPHKDLLLDPGPEKRLAMLRLALGDDPSIGVDECEIARGGLSYTIDTLRDVASRYPLEGKPALVLGEDLVPGFASWKRPEEIAQEADIICAHRSTRDRLPLGYPHRWADNPVVEISSSCVRERIAAGLPFRYLVPESVYAYIVQEGLYGFH
jgi:nicotinate-nucleotide adenylyltransferase